ncbi:hypothetical protein [Bosea psychrotolerans]|uniref:Uncharacterized protein n=1 Tax=Bosea psychrotolerans TaxID=1871628 RepID=A0A2S4M0R5_9HYPH|nr:hypothetical protein [Bosea psychrotolerans]POR48300.1 hypothetical protein CYD53_11548 [Bosea psychrotolerans]
MTTIPKNSTNEKADKKPKASEKKVDRPGFDLGGASGETEAGRGLGLGVDAKDDRKGQRLPR